MNEDSPSAAAEKREEDGISRRKRRRFWLVVILLLAAVILAFIFRPRRDDTELAEAVREDIEQTVSVTGSVTLQTGAEVNVGAEATGRIKALYVDVGDRVSAGQLLAELDIPGQSYAVRQAAAAVSSATGRLNQARAQQTQAERDAARARSLFAQGAISRSDMEIAVTRARTAAAEVSAAAAGVQQAQAEYERQVSDTAKARIYAPISGTVISVAARPGETVTAGFTTPTILTVADLKRLQIDASVDETDIGKISPGQLASIVIDAFPARTFRGRVVRVASGPTIQQNVVTYNVTMNIMGDTRMLKPQMTAAVDLITGKVRNALVIPVAALRTGDEGDVVYMPPERARGLFTERPVVTGVSNDRVVQILKGLKDGERVVVSSSRLERQLSREGQEQ